MSYKTLITIFIIFQLAACGGAGTSTDGVNEKPGLLTADAGTDQAVAVGSVVTLNGGGSSGGTLVYQWNLISKPAGSTASLLNDARVNPSFATDVAGSYVVQLIVSADSVVSLADSMTVVASSQGGGGSQIPDADAGVDQRVAVGTLVSLNGSGSSDPNAKTLSFQWILLSQPVGSSASLLGSNQVSPSFTADVAGNYVAQLIVNNGSADSLPDALTVTASVQNIRPVAMAGADKIIKIGDSVALDGSASYDPNGDSLIYRWSVITPNGVRTNGVFRSAKANFTPTDTGDYILELFVRDDGTGELKGRDEVRVTAATRVIDLTWLANTDNPAGYVIYAGQKGGPVDKQIALLVKGDGRWDPASPSFTLGWESALRAAGLASSSGEVCLAIRAYNGFGLSPPSPIQCFQKS